MVAKIIISKSIEKALNYNEHKLQNNQAICLYAGNFLKDADQMRFYEKLNRFKHQIALNDRATTNALHISLNFDPSENLSKKVMTKIAVTYMEKIGFGDQPYLVYQHLDAGHPHLHIVTTNIRHDGSRIPTHNIGRNHSEIARKDIEQEFHLLKAEGRNNLGGEGIESVKPEKVQYGKSETKRAVTNVLDAVINQYRYTSLAELNAILKPYNVLADRGRENGRIYTTGGLVYRVLDDQGNKIGVPIKASSIYSKPTLANIQAKFEKNSMLRKPHKQSVKDRIEQTLQGSESMQRLIHQLNQAGIDTVLRRNDAGLIYGITFVDHQTRCVFNGSDLGKRYTAAGIQQRLLSHSDSRLPTVQNAILLPNDIAGSTAPKTHLEKKTDTRHKQWENIEKGPENLKPLEELMKAEKDGGNVPYELRKKRKRKRKKRNNKL